MDLFGSFEVTLIAYLLGVLFTMASGYLVARFLDWVSHPTKKDELPEEITEESTEEATKEITESDESTNEIPEN